MHPGFNLKHKAFQKMSFLLLALIKLQAERLMVGCKRVFISRTIVLTMAHFRKVRNCIKMTHVNNEPGLSEDHRLWSVSGNVSVELLTIAIPLDRVQRIPL